MPEPVRWGPDNPHPLSLMKTELVWEGKYDEYAKSPRTPPGGIFNAVKIKFEAAAKTNLPDTVERIYSFRNEFIAHQEKELTDLDVAKQAMIDWIGSLRESFAASKDNSDMEAA